MTYVLGASTGDDITYPVMAVGPGDPIACITLVAGWWRPTTLTAGRGLWSFGNIYGAEIATTTSELRLKTDNTGGGSVDGEWVTSGLGLVVDQWYFLAFLLTTNNTGPVAAWRVWIGTESSPPREVTVNSSVSPVGNFATSNTFFVGNKGTGTVAFQGLVDWMHVITTTPAVTAAATPDATVTLFPLAALGAISNTEAEIIRTRFVHQAWLGDLRVMREPMPRRGGSFAAAFYGEAMFWPALDRRIHANASDDITNLMSQQRLVTINGATISQQRGPVGPMMVRFHNQ